MIRVTVEMIPKGDESRKRTLGVMEISNDGTGSESAGNYTGRLTAEYCTRRPGKVLGFRRQKQSVWTLVGAFLKNWNHVR